MDAQRNPETTTDLISSQLRIYLFTYYHFEMIFGGWKGQSFTPATSHLTHFHAKPKAATADLVNPD